MNDATKQITHRILVVDDNPNIHKDFQTILIEDNKNTNLDALRAEMFGNKADDDNKGNTYELDFASQGKEGYEKVKQACEQNNPYEMAFVDMRMPPGWDGLQTIEKIWEVDSKIQIVICTAYSDYSWSEISKKLGKSDNLLILKKPFDSAEVSQLAVALTKKWLLAKQAAMKTGQLEQTVEEKIQELTHSNNQLKAEIAERQQAELKLAELVKKVDNVNKELEDFASIVSHDLKAPLRGIKTLAVWIMDDCADKLDDKNTERMNLLLERVERMYSLIDGVLKYSRIGRSEENRIPVNLNEFVPELINMVAPPENIKITIENELPTIVAEEIHIMQLFQNLLSNAVKYMDKPQGLIKVSCIEKCSTEQNEVRPPDLWQFSIEDNGPGIDEKDFHNIFKMFRSLPVKQEFQGTGVGLSVAQKIVQMYGGRIWIESQKGIGSTFYFTLPKSDCKQRTKENENLSCVMNLNS
jgi:two-component system, NtrC family, sensor kinase